MLLRNTLLIDSVSAFPLSDFNTMLVNNKVKKKKKIQNLAMALSPFFFFLPPDNHSYLS